MQDARAGGGDWEPRAIEESTRTPDHGQGPLPSWNAINGNSLSLESNHAAIRAGLENGSLKPVIAEELPLAEAAKAQERVMQNGKIGKIILLP